MRNKGGRGSETGRRKKGRNRGERGIEEAGCSKREGREEESRRRERRRKGGG